MTPRPPSTAYVQLFEILKRHISAINARSVLHAAAQRIGLEPEQIAETETPRLVDALKIGLPFFLGNPEKYNGCVSELLAVVPTATPAGARGRRAGALSEPPRAVLTPRYHGPPEKSMAVDKDQDVVVARTVARQMSADLGFSTQDQVKVATAVSELTRNIVTYAKQGTIVLRRLAAPRPGIEVVASDNGPGITNLEAIMSGQYKSKRGMGMGLRGTKNLMDEMTVETTPGMGTTVRAKRFIQ